MVADVAPDVVVSDLVVADLVVIGGGTAGLVAARTARRLGASVVLIEGDRLGGDCLWTGCVPSKALIASAEAAHVARTSAHLGVSGVTDVDFAAVMRHVHGAIAQIAPGDSVQALERDGIRVLAGRARFTDAATLDVGGRAISFGHALIAVGASPRVPEIDGIETVEMLTSDSFWSLARLPARLLIVGGGPVGCEIAQAMARLGSAVTLVQRGPRLLADEVDAASDVVRCALETDGVRVLVGASVARVEGAEQAGGGAAGDGAARGGIAVLASGERIEFDAMLAAVGRSPRTAGLGLDAAGVAVDADEAVSVSTTLRTSNPNVWAAGDVTALPRYTHTASANAEIAASNALTGSSLEVDPVVARVTYTRPEVASVGAMPSALLTVHSFDHVDLDRAIVDADPAGFTSIVVDGDGIVRGATVVGPRAGDTIGELAVAVRHRMSTAQLAQTTHAYPSYGYAVRKLVQRDVRARSAG